MLPMIGYTLTQPKGVQQRFWTANGLLSKPQYNIRPGMAAPFIYAHQDGYYAIQGGLFGFAPPWDKDTQPNAYPIARSEKIQESVVFHEAFAKFRCLVPADGFYVWNEKKPYFVRLKTRQLFAMAGIFAHNTHHDPPLVTFALLSTFPNGLVAQVHHRMVVIIRPEDEARYLDPDTPLTDLVDMLLPIDEDGMEMYPVSPRLTASTENSVNFIRSLKELKSSQTSTDERRSGQLTFLD